MDNANEAFERAEAVARKFLGKINPDADVLGCPLEIVSTFYFYQPIRGGGAVIVAPDETFLFANSGLPKDKHVEAFTAGRRTDPALFE